MFAATTYFVATTPPYFVDVVFIVALNSKLKNVRFYVVTMRLIIILVNK